MSTQPPDGHRIPPDAVIIASDLDREDVTYHGKRLTEQRARRVALGVRLGIPSPRKAPTTSKRAGRPSLTGKIGAHTPPITVRVPDDLRARLDARADDDGVGRSDIVRAALEQYLEAEHGHHPTAH
ncbi:ribbon-helix-helix domain-containing protein [Cellulomonas sp. HZM]|uniref:ribbon-helix-helix domain-containing protein n=1 Tax=Cellulomonas sp. HZM TaxID=1454010 RepID=UPI00054DF9DB|nr:ribbon-helix-helix domain-containing protein [Cellulomonas sp. HZM]